MSKFGLKSMSSTKITNNQVEDANPITIATKKN